MDPQQELFTALRQLLADIFGEDNVYDGFLPPEGTAYPFVYIGQNQLVDEPNKGAVFGRVYQTIDVWHNDPHKRGTVSSMLLQIKQKARVLQKTSNFTWDLYALNQRILPDTTTSQPLLHGVIELEYRFS